ncbi:MAG TPA: excinuclease ABC subunit UvrA, partial [Clostridium sp.]|nr:excinuclease ABC subunit UvrA [Clostridium sp.]
MRNSIYIKGAKVHNLKNVDLEIPRDKFVVFTGLSGSGKSSLAFDTLYAEGQRRYVESLSAYARQFLGQMNKPDVEYIEGLSPAISIDQKTTSKNPRSTVGTVTEIYDYLRLLYAKIGVPHCPKCGKEITQQTVDQMVDQAMTLPARTKVQILAPVVTGKKGEHVKVLENIKKNGYVRARIDGVLVDLEDEDIKLEKNKKHTIEIVIDRVVIKDGIESRITDSLESALKIGEGIAILNVIDGEDILLSEKFSCVSCGISIGEIEPRMFSFNSPFGKCDECDGLGTLMEIDEDLVIPDKSKSILGGGILTLGEGSLKEDSWTRAILEALAKKRGFILDTPIEELSEENLNSVLYGTNGEKLRIEYTKEFKTGIYNYAYEGIINNLKRRYMETNSDYIKREVEEYMSDNPCPKCKGRRLSKEALSVTVGGKNISEFCTMSIIEELDFVDALKLFKKEENLAEKKIKKNKK